MKPPPPPITLEVRFNWAISELRKYNYGEFFRRLFHIRTHLIKLNFEAQSHKPAHKRMPLDAVAKQTLLAGCNLGAIHFTDRDAEHIRRLTYALETHTIDAVDTLGTLRSLFMGGIEALIAERECKIAQAREVSRLIKDKDDKPEVAAQKTLARKVSGFIKDKFARDRASAQAASKSIPSKFNSPRLICLFKQLEKRDIYRQRAVSAPKLVLAYLTAADVEAKHTTPKDNDPLFGGILALGDRGRFLRIRDGLIDLNRTSGHRHYRNLKFLLERVQCFSDNQYFQLCVDALGLYQQVQHAYYRLAKERVKGLHKLATHLTEKIETLLECVEKRNHETYKKGLLETCQARLAELSQILKVIEEELAWYKAGAVRDNPEMPFQRRDTFVEDYRHVNSRLEQITYALKIQVEQPHIVSMYTHKKKYYVKTPPHPFAEEIATLNEFIESNIELTDAALLCLPEMEPRTLDGAVELEEFTRKDRTLENTTNAEHRVFLKDSLRQQARITKPVLFLQDRARRRFIPPEELSAARRQHSKEDEAAWAAEKERRKKASPA